MIKLISLQIWGRNEGNNVIIFLNTLNFGNIRIITLLINQTELRFKIIITILTRNLITSHHFSSYC